MMVQLRPPKLGTTNEYGKRRVAPTRLGIEMSQKISAGVEGEAGGREARRRRCSRAARPRSRGTRRRSTTAGCARAMGRPGPVHWASSSGFQLSIHRPGRWTSSADGLSVAVPVAAPESIPVGLPVGAVPVTVLVMVISRSLKATRLPGLVSRR